MKPTSKVSLALVSKYLRKFIPTFKIYYLKLSELPCEVVVPLKDIDVTEHETVKLRMTLSKSRKIEWAIGDRVLSNSDDRFMSSVDPDGLEHTLTIRDVSINEHGQRISAQIFDGQHGNSTSDCIVTVKG